MARLVPPFDRARLVLFDIDGTILRNGNSAHGRSMLQACDELTGLDVRSAAGRLDAGGRTDRYIVNEMLRRSGFDQPRIDELFPRICARSIELTRPLLAEADPGWVLPGARAVIAELAAAGTAIGLVTGNLPEIATIKLRCAQIWEPFETQQPLIAGFGDLSEDRNDLTRAALHQAQTHDPSLRGDDVVIVGDTPRDIECATAIDAHCLAVATGRYTIDELRAAASTKTIVCQSLVPYGGPEWEPEPTPP